MSAEGRPADGDDEPENRGVTGTERPPAGSPAPDRVGSDEPMGTGSGDLAVDAAGGGAARGWDRAADLTKGPAVIPDPAEVEVPDELRLEIERRMALYPDRRSAVIPALHAAQRVHGWCSPEALRQVASVMRVTPAYLSSVASFYDQLNEEPVGRHHVYVCTSVACHLLNAGRVYDALAEAGADLEDTEIREFECLGACDMAPMASVDGRYVGPLSTDDAPEIVAAIREGREPLPGRGLGDPDYRLPWGGRA